MKHTLDVVVGEGAVVFKLLSSEDQVVEERKRSEGGREGICKLTWAVTPVT